MWFGGIEKDLLWQGHGYSDDEVCRRKAPSSSWVAAADGGILWVKIWRSQIESDPYGWLEHLRPHGRLNHLDNASPCGPLTHISLHIIDVSNGMEVYLGDRSWLFSKLAISYDNFGEIRSRSEDSGYILSPENTLLSCGPILLPIAWPPCLKVLEAQENRLTSGPTISFSPMRKSFGIYWRTSFSGPWVREWYVWEFLLECCLALKSCDGERSMIYEQVGWLESHTGKLKSDWKPASPVTRILIAWMQTVRSPRYAPLRPLCS